MVLSARKRVRERRASPSAAELGLCGWCGGTKGFHDDGVCRRPDRPRPKDTRPNVERGSRTAVLARAVADVNDARDALERVRAAKVLRGRADVVLLRVLDDLGRVVDDLENP